MKAEFGNNLLWSRARTGLAACLFSALTFNSALAAPVQIADVPPFLGGSVAPNIMFIIDDSGSMQFEMPETDDDRGTEYLSRSARTIRTAGISVRLIIIPFSMIRRKPMNPGSGGTGRNGRMPRQLGLTIFLAERPREHSI